MDKDEPRWRPVIVLPCVCGGMLRANPASPRDVEREVRHHQQTYQHQNWFRRSGW